MRSVRATIVAVEKVLVLHNLSIFLAWGMQHTMRIRHIITLPDPLCNIFPHSLTNGTIFESKKKKSY